MRDRKFKATDARGGSCEATTTPIPSSLVSRVRPEIWSATANLNAERSKGTL
jgi:hypothetical protein